MKKKIISGILAAIGLLVFIINRESALHGAIDGVNLCLGAVIPTLFPFIFFSNILIASVSSAKNSIHTGLYLTGYLGGYPVGAQGVAQKYNSGLLCAPETQRLIICCNNPGPAFILGLTSSFFTKRWIPWILWGVHILSSLLLSVIMPTSKEAINANYKPPRHNQKNSFDIALRSTASICGWIILFRAVINILQDRYLSHFPVTSQVVISGIIEITNGCMRLDEITSEGLRMILCAFFLSFGGCCTALQTRSVTGNMYPGRYLWCKAFEGCCSAALAYCCQLFLLPESVRYCASAEGISGIIFVIFVLVLYIRKRKNNSRILSEVGV